MGQSLTGVLPRGPQVGGAFHAGRDLEQGARHLSEAELGRDDGEMDPFSAGGFRDSQ